jgi:drug/metabolite transporter (DMT)-like permease
MNNLVLYVLTVLFWGTSWVAISFQLGVVEPEVSVVYRFAIAAAVLMGWCWFRRLPMRFGLRAHGLMMLQGVLLFSINYIAFYFAVGYIASGLASVAFSTIVGMNIIFGALFFGTPIRRRVVVGAGFGLVGMVMVFWEDVSALDLAAGGLIGFGLALPATMVVSLGNMVSVRIQRDGLPVVQTTAYGVLYGGTLTALVVLVRGLPITFEYTALYAGTLVFLAVFPTVLGFVFYLTLLGRLGADRAAYATVLFPIIALTLSTFYEDFEWTALSLAGVLVVLVGNAIVLGRVWRRRPAAAVA